MAQIILSGDGMTIEIEDEIARSDELLKRALSPHYPDLANALISREEREGQLKVTVTKRAGPKGGAAALGGNDKEGEPAPGFERAGCRNREVASYSEEGEQQPVSTNSAPDLPAGATVVQALETAPEYLNPVLGLSWRLFNLYGVCGNPARESDLAFPLAERMAFQAQISQALTEGEKEVDEISKTLELLKTVPAVSSLRLPRGF